MKRLIAALLALASLPAIAGDIYTCKGPHGEKVYQNTPCATPAAQLEHTTFVKPAAAPPPIDYRGENAAASAGEPRTVYVMQVPAAPAAVPAHAPTVAYLCQAGSRRWLQLQPCPVDYGVPVTMDVDGTTIDGQPVNGTGTAWMRSPVHSTPVDASAICALLDGRTTIRGAGDDAGQSYERNKLKRKYCGG